jgi:hypothetical protein
MEMSHSLWVTAKKLRIEITSILALATIGTRVDVMVFIRISEVFAGFKNQGEFRTAN